MKKHPFRSFKLYFGGHRGQDKPLTDGLDRYNLESKQSNLKEWLNAVDRLVLTAKLTTILTLLFSMTMQEHDAHKHVTCNKQRRLFVQKNLLCKHPPRKEGHTRDCSA